MNDSQQLRSRKNPFLGTNNSIYTEYSSGTDSGNDMVNNVSNYNTYNSDFDKETLVRLGTKEPYESYRKNSYKTIKEDIGESTEDNIFTNNTEYPFIPGPISYQIPESFITSFDKSSISFKQILFILILVLVLVSCSIYLYKYSQLKVKRDKQKIEREYEKMMQE